LHKLCRGAVGDGLGEVVPTRRLLGAEIGAVKDFLQADDLRTIGGSFADHRHVLVGRDLLDLVERARRRLGVGGLDQGAADDARHGAPYRTAMAPAILHRHKQFK